MIKRILSIIMVCACLLFPRLVACSGEGVNKNANPAVLKNAESLDGNKSSVNDLVEKNIEFNEIQGNWKLIYSGDFGYNFRFYSNYKSLVSLYLGNQALLFKGVYSIDKNSIRINIYEMKKENRISRINFRSGFMQAKSSFFVFRAEITEKGGKKALVLYPQQIKIDGSDSDGYFEPQIKLKYLGR